MDANKRLELLRIGYQIRGACGLCKHGVFAPKQDFGTCSIYTYQHLKHTGDRRQLSVHQYGSCDSFERDLTRGNLGLWDEFVV
jgi:hypothetical protein